MKFTIPDELIFLKNSRAKQHTSTLSLHNKVVLITGATSGIGLATAHRLAQDQASLIFLVRNKQKGVALIKVFNQEYNLTPKLFVADFTSFESVNAAATAILEAVDHIDVLINNAGMHATTFTLAPSGFEQVLTVNHLSPFLLTQRLFPAIAKAKGRIIFVNSEGHRFASFAMDDLLWKKRRYTGLRSYGAAKTAQLLTTMALAFRAKRFDVSVIAMHPGDVKSNIGKNNGLLYRTFSRFLIQPMLKDVDVASNALHFLSIDPSIEENSGKFYHLTILEKPAAFARDANKAEEVYHQSIIWTKLNKEDTVDGYQEFR